MQLALWSGTQLGKMHRGAGVCVQVPGALYSPGGTERSSMARGQMSDSGRTWTLRLRVFEAADQRSISLFLQQTLGCNGRLMTQRQGVFLVGGLSPVVAAL